ncbi:hypothetical protein LZV00_15305 [Pseudomonas kielensis]|uniref:hypothetical protein n=1 Tax=Pseudomonas kielensis TaxID=2762577 RepID=UPI00223FFB21|nr:hypothetical protein [Pseudomonas kielensis]UZM12120.1 hypothetical protein LZV00_15305 [Pseudomonas kielensis]
MRTDFEEDFLIFVLAELKKLNVDPPSRDLTACALLLFKLERRCPIVVPRQTALATSFSVPADLQHGFDGLCSAIHQGDPLSPYLSRSTFSVDKADGLLDDWGILHFHLGTERLPNGLIKGTKIVAFGLVRPNCVYFLDTYPHGPGHPDAWVREHLIHTIEVNWPSLLPTSINTVTPDALTPEQRINCRKKSVNVTVTKLSGEVIFPPGGGVMCNGTAMSDFTQLQRVYSQLDWARRMCESNEQPIRDALGFGDQDLRVHIGFVDRQMHLYEASTGIRIEFGGLN